jgi:hypothetical protein
MAKQGTKTRGLFEQARSYTPKAKPFLLPNGDKQHPCGCVTFWLRWDPPKFDNKKQTPDALYYRHACAAHHAYADRLGIIVAAKTEQVAV